jgi:hypothetical protein
MDSFVRRAANFSSPIHVLPWQMGAGVYFNVPDLDGGR